MVSEMELVDLNSQQGITVEEHCNDALNVIKV